MASQLAPPDQLEVPGEATGKQFALLEDEGRRREVGGSSHSIGQRRKRVVNLKSTSLEYWEDSGSSFQYQRLLFPEVRCKYKAN